MSFSYNSREKRKRDTVEREVAAVAQQQKAERDRLRRLLITLGDDETKKIAGQIRGLAGAVEDDVELHGETIADTVLDCVKNIPLKSSVYGALVGKMAAKHDEWISELIPKVLDEFRSAVRTGQSVTAQLLLRFLVCLGNTGVLGVTSLLSLLREILETSVGLRAEEGGDLGVFLCLSSLPHFSSAARKLCENEFDAIISQASQASRGRDVTWKNLIRTNRSEELPDRMEALFSSLESMKKNDWNSLCVFHIPGFVPSLEGKNLQALGMTQKEIKKSKVRFNVPLVGSRLLTELRNSSDDNMSEHDRWLLEDYILLVIETFGRDVEECAKQILKFPVAHQDFEAVVIETVFAQLLRLPSPPALPVFYSRLLETLAGKQTTTKPFIEKAFHVLIQKAVDLDDECIEVLAESFAYHLMQNNYSWDWGDVTGDNVNTQSQRFVRKALERLLRLSFHQNLLHRLPEAVHVHVPPEPVPAPCQVTDANREYTKLKGMVKIKDADAQSVITFCEKLRGETSKEQEEDNPAAEDKNETTKRESDVGSDEDAARIKRQKLDESGACKAVVPCTEDNPTAGDKNETTKKESDVDSDEDAARIKRQKLDESGACKAVVLCTEEALESTNGETTGKRQRDSDTASVKEEITKGTAETSAVKKEEDDDVPAEPWPLDAVTELLMLVVLQVGSKTPTHFNKVLDIYNCVFEALRPSDADVAHVHMKTMVRCVFQFWQLSGQRVEIVIDSLLQRGTVTPQAVVEQALAERGCQGCDSMCVRNMIDSVARKSLEHSQSLRVEVALAKKLGQADALETAKQQFGESILQTKELFARIFAGQIRAYEEMENTEDGEAAKNVLLQRILAVGRRYHMFIKPLIEVAAAEIDGVARNPVVAAIFASLRTL